MTKSIRGGEMGATIQTPENQEEEYHTDAEEAGQENVSQSKGEVPGEVTLSEAAGGSGWRVMTNPIMMEKISNFLSDKDLLAMCLASKTTKKIVDQMDPICWRKRALKLEAVLREDATVTTDPTSYKERFLIFKSKVERLANRIRAKIEDNSGSITVSGYLDSKHFSLQELASTASLIHHNMLGEVSCKRLCLAEVNLSSIPNQQLGSLAACVTDQVFFGVNVIIPDLGVLLDKVKCDNLTFLSPTFNTEETLAMVRAMQTRVRIVILIHSRGTVDVRALKMFDGKGRCEQVWVLKGDSIENAGIITEEDMRQLAQTIDWDFDVIVEQSVELLQTKIIFKRK